MRKQGLFQFSSLSQKVTQLLNGEGLKARATRGTTFTIVGYGAQQFIRLLSNLVLTRLLLPEAFGLMALVTVVLIGLTMVSDTGINPAIVQSKRGDEPDFLNTAWSIQIARGLLLWGMAAALALPMAQFYGLPQLAILLPVAGFISVIQSFQSMRLASAVRHVRLGRLMMLEISSLAIGSAVTILLAWSFRSVWALVIGALIGAAVKSLLSHLILHGNPDRLRWEPEAFWEIFHFGKYIFFGSIAGFLVNHGDRIVLGKFISVAELGVYNIGYFMATVPYLISTQIGARVLTPVFAKNPPRNGPANKRNIRTARLTLTSGLLALGIFFALIGIWLIGVLYDAKFALAGPIMVMLSLSFLPTFILGPYSNLLLASGRSRNFTAYVIALGIVQLALMILLTYQYGIAGAVITPGLAALLVYPLVAWMAHLEMAWDPMLDLFFLVVIVIGAITVLGIHDSAIKMLS